jgi:transcriptional regulator GlxA family with amidase domain
VDRRRIAFVIFEGFQPLDLAGPHEVFQNASALTGHYACEVVAPRAGLVRSRSGLLVLAGSSAAEADPAGIDTLIVAGGSGVDQARLDTALTGWIALAAGEARRVASVCSGVFLLAAAGVLARHRTRGRALGRSGAGAVLAPPRKDPVDAIARRCGFGTAETLRRAFHRTTRVAPSDYRNRFRTAGELL